jgi:8-oxo-dGTP pyrophosphatase MutT (NUDIX family)
MDINFTSKTSKVVISRASLSSSPRSNLQLKTNLSATPESYVPPRFDYSYNRPSIVTSFGIMAFIKGSHPYNTEMTKLISRAEYPPDLRLLLIQRRNTMGYIDFIRGRQFFNDISIMKRYLSEMTNEERYKIKTLSFDELWDDIWYNKNSKPFKQDRKKSKNKYVTLNIEELLQDTSTIYSHTEFGIPKGRKNQRESDIECAMREFNEETGYSENDYTLIPLPPLVEKFIGTNNVEYKHVYYYAVMNDNNFLYPSLDVENHKQCEEVFNLEFLYEDDIKKVIRDYDTEKMKIISEAFIHMKTYSYQRLTINKSNCNEVFNMDDLSY